MAIDVSGFSGKEGTEVRIYAVGADHDFEVVRTEVLTGHEYILYVNLIENAVYGIKKVVKRENESF